jgi:PLP dependent protein
MTSANIENIRQRIALRCAQNGRKPDEIALIAVAKTFPADAVAGAVAAGVLDIGENYVQELLEKRKKLPSESIRWHFIGHLQSNKVRHIAPWVTMIHAVDSHSLAAEIDRRWAKAGKTVDILIEVNTTGEESKFGTAPGATAELVRGLAGLASIRVAGLMTIGPFLPDPEGSRPMFKRLRELRDEIAALGQPNAPMHHLSMGMTGDFEVAIDEGATLVRIGTAIFGSRKKPA